MPGSRGFLEGKFSNLNGDIAMRQLMRVSVIIPTRDRPLFLEDAVRSVLEQTRSVHEIIVVDDGSKAVHHTGIDHTVSLSSSIRLLRLPESTGVAAARNAGLDLAAGDAVLFLDDDDLLHPRMVETGLSMLEREPEAGVSTCLYEMFFTPDGEGPWISAALLFNYRMLDSHPLRLIDHTNFAPKRLLESRPFSAFLRYLIPIHTCLVRREAIGAVRFPVHLPQGEDTFFWLALAEQGVSFRMTERPLVLVRRHGRNVTRSRRQYFEEIPAFYEAILEKGMIAARDDLFLVNLKLMYFSLKRGDLAWLRYAGKVALRPGLLAKEIQLFVSRSCYARKQLLHYYFLD